LDHTGDFRKLREILAVGLGMNVGKRAHRIQKPYRRRTP
jgi:hypothetical protein